MAKPKKIEIDKGAFDSIPEAEREEAMKAVLEAFKDVDLDDLPGQRVMQLPPGTTECPACKGLLVVAARVQGGVILDCEDCDVAFMTETQ